MSWASELPAELLCRPTGLVVLTGLDITYNAIHKSIWDSFCNNRRSDRVPLKFDVQEADHVYPKSKQKRTSYQWHIPKGILKRTWMTKHLNEVPAVVVVFYDLDWDEFLWKEKQMECATRVEIVRNSLQGQGTKVAVVLIQKNTPLPPGEDVMAAERASSLCNMCDISAKSLYVLPHTDHLIGYTIRLENAFYELSQSYYHLEARKVKSHKDFLNKTTHQLFYVRHQFKIAFFNELKQDSHTALKHYKQAYGHILDLRMYDTNMLEIKTMAGFVNYKICRLSFQHNIPLDAIAQFRKHIDFFKSTTGTPELAFENSAWMSKQFQVFGDLFDEAIKLGLTALQTQHPGFYYQQAANHSITRKQLCHALCMNKTGIPNTTILDGLDNLEYFGQRPWRQGHQSIDPPDAQKEKEGILALQMKEKQEDHSWIIIPLLSSAVAQFKKYKSPRMKRHLMVQMGEEYFHAKDYGKALMLLNKVMWDYRAERWSPILTSILTLSLKCAYLTAKVQEYVSNCMELSGQYSQCSIEEKSRIEKNLTKVMSNDAPDPEPGLDQVSVESAKSQWLSVKSESSVFTIEMSTLVSFIDCKARFIGDSTSADTKVKLEVYLRVTCPLPIRFSKLSVHFNNQVHNSKCEISDGRGITAASSPLEADGADLYLLPGKPRLFTFSFLPTADDVGSYIEITSVALELGTGCCSILRWVGTGTDTTNGTSPKLTTTDSGISTADQEKWQQFKSSSTMKILPRSAKLNLSLVHQSPSLLNEFYPVHINICNEEENAIQSVNLYIALENEHETSQDPGAHISLDKAEIGDKMKVKENLDLPDLKPGQKIDKCFYIKCFQPGTRSILTKVKYTVIVSVGIQHSLTCQCIKEETINLTTVSPFDVSINLQSMKFEHVEALHAEEPFLLNPEISCTSPWPIELQTSEVQLVCSEYIKTVSEKHESQITSVKLKKAESAAECLCLVSLATIQPSVSLGTYTVFWRRRKEDKKQDLPYVSTSFPLPTVNIEHIPISVSLKLPAYGSVKTLLPICYVIKNRTPYIQEIEVNMDASDNFMFAGNKHTHFRVLPGTDYLLKYNLFPLVAGHLALPKLHVNMVRYPNTMDEIIQKMLPTHIFIRPLGKSIILPA
ncbi:hypothetical protein LOTGIDRAFT_209465 [Lottia gigantea]|uniref:Trafficking protein particle complex subunit 11 n=1 Tax=Lottia gigantea TaxID=225164 RepID=V4AAZ2_LOTGI|nr:hypothetical protein LOTGIDRAFT_209465 [Lottia gigantea]ESO93952.1 hypothetical protein LOTGIDRAFT_209465 [Lottia gigantea]